MAPKTPIQWVGGILLAALLIASAVIMLTGTVKALQAYYSKAVGVWLILLASNIGLGVIFSMERGKFESDLTSSGVVRKDKNPLLYWSLLTFVAALLLGICWLGIYLWMGKIEPSFE
jgi:hypothetical protein